MRGASSESQSNEITSAQSNLGRLIASDPSPVVVESQRSSDPQENQSNQSKLIELLTARGGVTEVEHIVTLISFHRIFQNYFLHKY